MRTLYPIHVEPVSVGTETHRWHQPLSEPTRRAGLAVALIASGCVISPWALTQAEAVTVDRWQQALSAPVRPKALAVAHQQASTFVPVVAAAAETVTADKWVYPFSEPVRAKRGLADEQQPALAFVQAAPFAETVSADRWLYAFSQPIRSRALPVAHLAPTAFVDYAALPLNEWFEPLAEPRRVRRLPSEFAVAAPLTEIVTSDKWHMQFSLPLASARMSTAMQVDAATVPVVFASSGSDDGWLPYYVRRRHHRR